MASRLLLVTTLCLTTVSYTHLDVYKRQTKLHAPLNEAYHRYDSIGYREHTAEDEKRAEMEMCIRDRSAVIPLVPPKD